MCDKDTPMICDGEVPSASESRSESSKSSESVIASAIASEKKKSNKN